MKNIVVYEDIADPWFYPVNQLRAGFELKAGMFSFLERMFLFFSEARYHLFYRDFLKPVLRKRYPDFFHNTANVGLDVLFINGRVVMTEKIKAKIEEFQDEDFLIVNQDQVICFRLRGNKVKDFVENGVDLLFQDKYVIKYFRENQNLKVISLSAKRFDNIWQIISENGNMIINDFNLIDKGGLILSKLNNHTILTNEKDIYIGKHSKISPLVHIDATNGPVYIGRDVEIKSHVLLEGPVFVDNGAKIFPGHIRENTTIGENCRIGGEVESSIFLSNTNKYHAGFIGHSYVGEWVNFGALTTTSDLKNNYKEITLDLGADTYDTKTKFLGSIVGDHCKFGIGTMINTGTIFGIGVNLVGIGAKLSKRIAAFSWIVEGQQEKYLLEKFIETVKVVKERRAKELYPEDVALLEYLYFQSASKIKKC